MTRNQYIVLSVVAVAGVVLFYKGYKSSHKELVSAELSTVKNFRSYDQYIEEQIASLPDSVRNVLVKSDESNTTSDLKIAVEMTESLNKPLLAAHYFEKYALVDNQTKNWLILGGKWYNLAMSINDSVLSYQLAGKAKSSLNKVLEKEPENLDAKNALAACYVEFDKDVMKGVSLLREVLQADSNNIQAIFTLGMLSIQSNQLDKALARFEKLVKLQPFNPQYYFYLAEVQAKTGETKQAIQTYEKCKTLVSDKETQKEIDIIIQKLNQL